MPAPRNFESAGPGWEMVTVGVPERLMGAV